MALFSETFTDDGSSDALVVEDASGGANVLYFSGVGTWDSATVSLVYVQESGSEVALADWTFTDDFATTVPVRDGLVFKVTVSGAGGSTDLDVELK